MSTSHAELHHVAALVNTKNAEGDAPLHLAVLYRKAALAERLLLNGADVHVTDNNGNTPLHIAVLYHPTKIPALSRADIAKILLDNGADVNAKNLEGKTPLQIAVEKKTVDMIRLLIASGADTTATNSDGTTLRDLANPKIQDIVDNGILVRTMWGIWQKNNADLTDSYAKWPPSEVLADIFYMVEKSKPLANIPKLR